MDDKIGPFNVSIGAKPDSEIYLLAAAVFTKYVVRIGHILLINIVLFQDQKK